MSTIVKLKSDRGTEIITEILVPELKIGEKCPLVFLVHGFLGERNECGMFHGGAYTSDGVADELLDEGIASVRVDFAGSGESEESFEGFTPENMLRDLEIAYKYVVSKYAIDEEKLGILGWSMGGRVAAHFVSKHPKFKTMVLWAPAVLNGDGDLQFIYALSKAAADGSAEPEEYIESLKKEAKENGRAYYNQEINEIETYISADFFEQMKEGKPLDWIRDYKGDKFVIIPEQDTVISELTYQKLCSETGIKRVFVKADHDLGFDTEMPEVTLSVIDMSVAYLLRHLR